MNIKIKMKIKKTALIAAVSAALLLFGSCAAENVPETNGTSDIISREETTMTDNETGAVSDVIDDGYTYCGDFGYIASGFEQKSGEQFSFRSGFEMQTKYAGDFNRFTFAYSSDAPLRCSIKYVSEDADGKRTEKTETFFLEDGADKTFSFLIDGYARGVRAKSVEHITAETADKTRTRFMISEFSTDTAEIFSDGTFYIENDRFRVGVLLEWGGGISYIEDKNDGDPSITNLINHCDTGRLIQQSYYGVGNGKYYTGAKYGENNWNYNPVQGGDQYGNPSKIVDFRLSDDGKSLYIKAQPMDWAQNNQPCPAYMENTYTLLEDGIRVDNRFVDFFGVPHPKTHQELPAFYVISNLGVFHYYNGTKPWTNDAYITLPDEPFWAGKGSAYHNVVAGNTETWAAWTNTDGYGIGLYVPGTEIMLAGRYEYNGSKSAADPATNYVAPLRSMNIVSFKPFSYSYVITAGTVGQMRDVFAKYKD